MKRIAALLLALTLLVSMAGCAKTGAPVQQPEPPAQSAPETQEPAAHYPVTLTDQGGRAVTMEAQPERIVSGYYISTSLLIALGQQDKLVGVEAKADQRPIYHLSAPELLDLPSVGSAKEFDLEGCAALEPDLVILPLKLRDAAATLEELGISVLLVNPESQELLDGAIELVSAATGSQDRAQALFDFTAAQKRWLEERLEGAERPTVYLGGNSSFLSTAGGQMYQSDMIRLAGGENVAQDIGDTYWVEVSQEQVLAWDPDFIVLAPGASYGVKDLDLTGLRGAEQNLWVMPSKAEAWDSPVPSGILGSVWLAGVLHPDLCPPEECDGIIEEYYETFYGFFYSQA